MRSLSPHHRCPRGSCTAPAREAVAGFPGWVPVSAGAGAPIVRRGHGHFRARGPPPARPGSGFGVPVTSRPSGAPHDRIPEATPATAAVCPGRTPMASPVILPSVTWPAAQASPHLYPGHRQLRQHRRGTGCGRRRPSPGSAHRRLDTAGRECPPVQRPGRVLDGSPVPPSGPSGTDGYRPSMARSVRALRTALAPPSLLKYASTSMPRRSHSRMRSAHQARLSSL